MRHGLFWFAAGVFSLAIFFAIGGTALLNDVVVWTAGKAQAATVFFVQSTTSAQIQNKYYAQDAIATTTAKSAGGGSASGGKVRIFIVPGHQPNNGGTVFKGVYERDVVVDIADTLATLLAQNPHYDVMVSRTKTAWHPILQSYFDTHMTDIETFRQSQALQMANHLIDGSFVLEEEQVYHNTAPSAAALQLYGINKWTNDNEYDIILHLHLNDYVRPRAKVAGTYDGFSIYVPDRQYSNAAVSRSIAEAISARLNKYHATSTLPKEDVGIVPDQQLIAVGSNNSADNAALLIEYGYIYESQFQKPSVLSVATADYAYQTYLGLQDFFKDPVMSTYGSISFPYDWTKVTGKKDSRGPGVYALQAALHHLGYYPPVGKSFSDCPISGKAGSCTRAAIEEYQRTHNLEAIGILGPKTRAALNRDLIVP